MVIYYKGIAALFVMMSLYSHVFAGWELYDDFNDSFLDTEKWDFPSGTQALSESSGYLKFLGSRSDTVSSVLRSKLAENDVIKGVRVYIYLTDSCDFNGDVSMDSMQTGMVTRSLTTPTGGFSNDYVFAYTYLNIDNTAEDFESNYVETHLLSSLYDGQSTDGQLSSISSVLESVRRENNHKYTGGWFRLTADFSEISEMRTSASWSSKTAIYQDPALVPIQNNVTTSQANGAGKFDLIAHITPRQGASTACNVYMDHVEVLRIPTTHVPAPPQYPGIQ